MRIMQIDAPPSKSCTQRALIIASLAEGKTIIRNPLLSEDTDYMVSGLRQFGIKIEKKPGCIEVHGSYPKQPKKTIFIGNNGTAMRFLTAFASLVNGKTAITGGSRMQKRPIKGLLSALRQLKVKTKSTCYPPVTIESSGISGGRIIINAEKSSQYLSALLMILPYAKKTSVIKVTGLASKPYIDITLDIMKHFGIKIKNNDYKTFKIKPKKYKASSYMVEGDASSASYFLALAAIAKKTIKVINLNPKSAQGDMKFADLLKKMGCKVKKGNSYIMVTGRKLMAITADMNAMPDMVQTLAAVAMFAEGTTRIKNISNLKIKETDRIAALKKELAKLGAKVKATKDSIAIAGNSPKPATIETYNDHRMAMSFGILTKIMPKIKIRDPGCVKKSFPDFWKELKKL